MHKCVYTSMKERESEGQRQITERARDGQQERERYISVIYKVDFLTKPVFVCLHYYVLPSYIFSHCCDCLFEISITLCYSLYLINRTWDCIYMCVCVKCISISLVPCTKEMYLTVFTAFVILFRGMVRENRLQNS